MHIEPLIEGEYFHMYNRGVNGEDIFKEPRNYYYFLQQYILYCPPVFETLAYTLLKKTFHFLVYVKEDVVVPKHKGEGTIQLNASRQPAHFFNSYAQSINKAENRTGPLLESPCQRKMVDEKSYLTSLIYYCHYNAQLHEFVDDFNKWKYSSCHAILNKDNSFLASQTVLEWFGGTEAFEKVHENRYVKTGLNKFTIA